MVETIWLQVPPEVKAKKEVKCLPTHPPPPPLLHHLLILSHSYHSLLLLINELSSSRIHLCNTQIYLRAHFCVYCLPHYRVKFSHQSQQTGYNPHHPSRRTVTSPHQSRLQVSSDRSRLYYGITHILHGINHGAECKLKECVPRLYLSFEFIRSSIHHGLVCVI